MDVRLPEGLSAAAKRPPAKTRRKKLYLLSDGQKIEVLETWDGGFSTPNQGPSLTRGIVDLYQGRDHMAHGLAYLASVEDDCRVYAFKVVRDPQLAPPSDHERLKPVPAGLLGR